MRLVWLGREAFSNVKSRPWFVWDDDANKKFLSNCNTYAPAFRLVTVESAREDYGVCVP